MRRPAPVGGWNSIDFDERVGRRERDETVAYLQEMLAGEYISDEEFITMVRQALDALTWRGIWQIIEHLPDHSEFADLNERSLSIARRTNSSPQRKSKAAIRARHVFQATFSAMILFAWAPFRAFTDLYASHPGPMDGWGAALVVFSVLGGIMSLMWWASWGDNHD